MNPTSPTGTALLPPKIVPYLIALVAVAAGVVAAFPGTQASGVAQVIIAVGALLGIASPGLRKSPDELQQATDAGSAAAGGVNSQASAVDVLKGKR